MPRIVFLLAVCLLVSSARALTIDWTFVGGPSNDCDQQAYACIGAVGYAYNVSKYEITNSQYAEFLNAVAQSDTYDLYNPNMSNGDSSPPPCSLCDGGHGGIVRSGASGGFTYSVIAGRGDMPVNYVSFYDALRFVNWLSNGQPIGVQGSNTTEDGAYSITSEGIANNTIVRNANASLFLTSADEWYKAAFYDVPSQSYFAYPASSGSQTGCSAPTAAPNRANCEFAVGDLTHVGAYSGAASPNGTYDQGCLYPLFSLALTQLPATCSGHGGRPHAGAD